MYRHLLFLVVLGGFLFSCKDEITPMKDEITYQKYASFKVLSPADSVGEINQLDCEKAFPYPADSSVFVEIDMNQDGANDYRFTYTTKFEEITTGDSCKNYQSFIEVSAMGIGNAVLVDKLRTNRIQIYEEDENISKQAKRESQGYLYLDKPDATIDTVNLTAGNKYMGIQMMEGGLGWVKFYYTKDSLRLTLMEQAFNHNIHLGIKAGQKN